MGKTLYLECESGISGDMSVAALLDLGADENVLRAALDSLNVGGLAIGISRVNKSGVDCADFDVRTGLESDGHDHDMEYLYGHLHDGHGHHHGDGQVGHAHRNLLDIQNIINNAKLTEGARKLAFRIFDILAQAEAKAHGVGINEVHFHEVGAVDSIADIVGFAVCYDNLGIERTVVADIAEGSGTVRCQHGILPVPVPAVANIAAAHNLRLKNAGIAGELVTPTGAAIAAAVRTDEALPDNYTVKAIGLGAGKRQYELPGFVRAMIIEDNCDQGDSIYRLESDIDDCSGEVLGYVQELLYKAGAREVHYVPVYMKKNRPAYELVVICDAGHINSLEQIIFEQTTTIGIRRVKMERAVLEREIIKIDTGYGEAQVKVCNVGGRKVFYPEYESVAAISRANGLPYMDVYESIRRICADGI